MADWPENAADTPDCAASTRTCVIGQDANWNLRAASQTVDITKSLYLEGLIGGTPFSNRNLGTAAMAALSAVDTASVERSATEFL